jgi:hypothetical protein
LYGRQAARAKMNAFELRTDTKEYQLEENKSLWNCSLPKAVGVQASATAEAKLIGNYFKQGILQKTDLHPFKFALMKKKTNCATCKTPLITSFF